MTPNEASPLKRYVVVYPFEATQDDEISLAKGDAIMVAEVYKDSWMKGIRLRDMAIGFFPGNFVRPLPITSSGEIKESKRCFVAKEILTTEMSYGRFLWQLEEEFAEPLKSKGIISQEEYSKLFGHTQALVKLNEDLVGQLRLRIPTWDDEKTLMGDIFVKRAPLLKLLEGYALQFPQARQVMDRLQKSNRAFAAFCASAEGNSGQTLLSLLMNPIQRAPRYELLLKELLKKTDSNHPDAPLLSEALSQVVKINMAMNENLRRMENEQRIIDIKKSFPNDDIKIFQASRQFNLDRTNRKQKGSKEEKFLQKRKRLSSFGGSSSPTTPVRQSPQIARQAYRDRNRHNSEPAVAVANINRGPARGGSLTIGRSPKPKKEAHFRFSLSLPTEDDGSGEVGGNSPALAELRENWNSSPLQEEPDGHLKIQLRSSTSTPSVNSATGLPSSPSGLALSSPTVPLSPSLGALGSESLFDTSTQRFFIREGSVYLTGNAGVERYLFVFTDLLLISTITSRSRKTYKLKERAVLSQCWVLNGKSFNRSFPNITIVFGTPSQLHNWVFLREDEKNSWQRDIERYVMEQKNYYLGGAVDETDLPDEVFRFVTFKARSIMKPMLDMELEIPANEEVMVFGFEGTNGKWQPALATTDPDNTGIEWWFGSCKDHVGWFPVGCIPETEQLSALGTTASQCKVVPIDLVQKMKQLWSAETGKHLPSLGSMRIAKIYDTTGSFKTTRVNDDATIDSLISAYYHHGLLYAGRTWDLIEAAADGKYERCLSSDESPSAIVDQWGSKYRDLMKFVIREKPDQPRSRLFTATDRDT